MGKKETWKTIKGFDNMYEISDKGNVRSWRTRKSGAKRTEPIPLAGGIYRTKNKKKLPYRYFLLTDNTGKRFAIKAAVLVLTAFSGKRPKGLEASHKNGNCQDDSIKNLVWESKTNNFNRIKSHRKKRGSGTVKSAEEVKILIRERNVTSKRLSTVDVKEIKFCLRQGISDKELAIQFNTTTINIYNIKTGFTFKNIKAFTEKQRLAHYHQKQLDNVKDIISLRSQIK